MIFTIKNINTKTGLFLALAAGVLLGGCTQAMNFQGQGGVHFDPTVVFRPAETEYILTCLQEMRGLKKRDVEKQLKKARGKKFKNGTKDQLHYTCLTLHQAATYKQFTDGMATLKQYVDASPESHADLLGLLYLMERLDQARISRWSARKNLGKEKKKLTTDIEDLSGQLEQANNKIEELNDQVNKLKNIEKIISNREQHDKGTISYE